MRNAVVFDPVLETVERNTKYIKELYLNIIYEINTHVHADHITETDSFKKIINPRGYTRLYDLESTFTGDTLLIQSCGRIYFQEGSADKLYDSVHNNIFTLPDHYKLYLAYYHNGVTNITVKEEMKYSP
uniref:MBL fold metallo-hydrolase n=1 Tax=Strongyloides papillosus TaxID=174720 RepID=A0A0N5CEN8_STREA